MDNSSLAVVANITSPAAAANTDWITYFFSAFSFAGLILNSLVFVFILQPNVIPGKIPRAFLLNQVIGEWLCCLLRSFSWITDKEWTVPDSDVGTFICKLMYSQGIYYSTGVTSYANVILLVVERYVSVVHPMHHKKFTPTLVGSVIALNWVTGPIKMIYRFVDPSRLGTRCILVAHDWRIYAPVVIIWAILLPIVGVSFLNARIVYVMKKHSESMHASGSNPLRKKLQRDLTMSVLTTCIALTVTLGPLAVVYLLMNFEVIKKDFRGQFYLTLTYISSTFFVINPLAYMFQMRAIRRQAAALFCCRAIRSKMGRTSQSGNEGGVSTSNSTKKSAVQDASNGEKM